MSFALDNFKREYSNSEKDQVLKYLNENFDPKNFKFYLTKFNFKFDDIPSVSFVRANRIHGYFQQFDDKMHKLAFGVGFYKDNMLSFVWLLDIKDGFPKEMKDSSMHDNFDWQEIEKDNENIATHLFDEHEECYVFK